MGHFVPFVSHTREKEIHKLMVQQHEGLKNQVIGIQTYPLIPEKTFIKKLAD